jgi:DNA-binding NarL/FixJ family response regulator
MLVLRGRCIGAKTEVSLANEAKAATHMKILVVDDHSLIREALRGVLTELKREAELLDASTCKQALRLIEEAGGDFGLILLDLNLPDGDGFSVLADLRERYPAVSIVVLSGMQDRETVLKALDLGALGFIPKSASRDVMLSALQLVFAGGIYIPPEVLSREPTAAGSPSKAKRNGMTPSDLGLTGRQIDVLALMMQGKSNKAICRLLDLAEPTVKNHVTAILKALKVTNRTEAVIAANELGWDLSAQTRT